MADSNLIKIEIVAKGLGDLCKEVVFVGGSVTELYADSAVAEEIRATEDVDIVVKMVSRYDFCKFEETIRKYGFVNDMSEGAPICRWVYNGIKVDVLPVDRSILGFGNKWYDAGFKKRELRTLNNNIEIFIFPLMIYMATKLEAVKDRGLSDLRFSHDFEDIIYLFDNCSKIHELFDISDKEIKEYLSKEFSSLKNLTVFKEAVLYALPYGSQNERIAEILENIVHIIKNGRNY